MVVVPFQGTPGDYKLFLRKYFLQELLPQSYHLQMERDQYPAAERLPIINEGWHYGFTNWFECPAGVKVWGKECQALRIHSSGGTAGFRPQIDRRYADPRSLFPVPRPAQAPIPVRIVPFPPFPLSPFPPYPLSPSRADPPSQHPCTHASSHPCRRAVSCRPTAAPSLVLRVGSARRRTVSMQPWLSGSMTDERAHRPPPFSRLAPVGSTLSTACSPCPLRRPHR